MVTVIGAHSTTAIVAHLYVLLISLIFFLIASFLLFIYLILWCSRWFQLYKKRLERFEVFYLCASTFAVKHNAQFRRIVFHNFCLIKSFNYKIFVGNLGKRIWRTYVISRLQRFSWKNCDEKLFAFFMKKKHWRSFFW